MRHFVVLPGMHGTTKLMDDFAASAPHDARVDLVALPAHLADYDELASHFAPTLELAADSILIAESFSGPLAILLAARIKVAALVLCGTFAKAPYPRVLSGLPLALLARVRPSSSLVRFFIVGARAPESLVTQVQSVVDMVPAETMANRTRSALEVDVRGELARCTSPILYLRGTGDHLIHKWSLETIVRAATVPVSVANIPAPHLLLKTSPREAWRAINAFLEDAGIDGDAAP
ncbi:MAG: alpha/beta hydrolase [Gemmatimonadota bacterium]